MNEPGEALVLADGTRILPNGRVAKEDKDEMIEVPRHSEAVEIIMKTRRKVSELPDIPKAMNAISIVLAYEMFGLEDIDIAVATGLTIEQVQRIKAMPAYIDMRGKVVSNIIESDAVRVQDIFKQASRKAANKLINFADSDSDVLSFAAVKEILDRAGMTPKAVVEHQLKVDGGLRFEIVERKDGETTTPQVVINVGN